MPSTLRSRIVIATALLAVSAFAVGTVNYHLATRVRRGQDLGIEAKSWCRRGSRVGPRFHQRRRAGQGDYVRSEISEGDR